MCSYSLGVPNYRLTYPPKSHPSTSPYTNLSTHFKQLVKDGQLHRLLLKAILYPSSRNVNTMHVQFRRKQNVATNRRRHSLGSSSDPAASNDTNEYHEETEGTGTITSDVASSEASSVGFIRYDKESYGLREASHDTNQDTFVDRGSKFDVDCTRDIFASLERARAQRNNDAVPVDRDSDGSFIFMHNRKNSRKCDMEQRDSLKYYSKPVRVVIDRNNQGNNKTDSIVHTSTAQLIIGGKNAIGATEALKPGRKVSDLSSLLRKEENAAEHSGKIDDSLHLPAGNAETLHGDERHSMPTLFVGNRFNCSSLTEVYIPSYRVKADALSIDQKLDDIQTEDGAAIKLLARDSVQSLATTHSSSIDIPAMIPAPNDMTAELLYNLDQSEAGPSTSAPVTGAFGKDVIKPPSMFQTASRVSLNREPSPFSAHALNADKRIVMRRKSGEERSKNQRCISYHYINMQGDEKQQQHKLNVGGNDDTGAKGHTKKCECCASSRCPSPRSSDSGMAGSCTISSPDAPIKLFDHDYEQFGNLEYTDEPDPKLHGLMHSQSSHNFGRFHDIAFRGDNNHDSGQYGHSSLAPEDASADALRESDINNMFELSMSRDTVKRQSRCQSAERTIDMSASANNANRRLIFKTGLYAHWWKKEALPSAVLRDIHNLVHPHKAATATQSRAGGSAKPQRIGWNINHSERSQPEGGELFTRVGWGSGKTFFPRALLSFSVLLFFTSLF